MQASHVCMSPSLISYLILFLSTPNLLTYYLDKRFFSRDECFFFGESFKTNLVVLSNCSSTDFLGWLDANCCERTDLCPLIAITPPADCDLLASVWTCTLVGWNAFTEKSHNRLTHPIWPLLTPFFWPKFNDEFWTLVLGEKMKANTTA